MHSLPATRSREMRSLPGRAGRIFFGFRAVLEEPGPKEDEAEEPTAGPW